MDYDEILAQTLELLQQEKRLSYRILKRRLDLEDDDLEDLKEDLIYAKKLARDEDGRVLAVLADVYANLGQSGNGLRVLDEALAVVDKTGIRGQEAELYRLKGVLLLQQTVLDVLQAEACFHQALDIARQQQAKSWELRAATCLARLWQGQDKRRAAHDLLQPVYGWFTEGFDTADLKDAKVLLDELAG